MVLTQALGSRTRRAGIIDREVESVRPKAEHTVTTNVFGPHNHRRIIVEGERAKRLEVCVSALVQVRQSEAAQKRTVDSCLRLQQLLLSEDFLLGLFLSPATE